MSALDGGSSNHRSTDSGLVLVIFRSHVIMRGQLTAWQSRRSPSGWPKVTSVAGEDMVKLAGRIS